MLRYCFLLWISFGFGLPLFGQNKPLTVIRGTVVDKESKSPLVGVEVVLIDSLLKLGAISDDNGRFLLQNVPVGRVTVKVRYAGYDDRLFSNLQAGAGKEVILNVELEEKIAQGEEVVIEAAQEKDKALNTMSTVSARTFTIEETGRYAGSLNDPARMASNFAGVVSAGDTRNDIVIRGNSPLGLIWRVEGVDIPNPNHFATQGANGGPISMLNNNVLANSDFMTGAFPAEYGNGFSGVFDLKFRNGNPNRRETTFQIGFNGLELMSEGPINKSNGSSYLLSYRYSTLAVFSAMGIQFGDILGIPKFQDLSFKVNLPVGKAGTFSIWGIGGMSQIDIRESELSREDFTTLKTLDYQDVTPKNRLGVGGITHQVLLSDKTWLRTTLVTSNEWRSLKVDSVTPNQTTLPDYNESLNNNRITITSALNTKINARHSIRIGFFLDQIGFKMKDSLYIARAERYVILRDAHGSTQLLRGYGQWQYKASTNITFNTGLHYLHLFLNNTQAIEPRAGVRWQATRKTALNLGYGLHNQQQMLPIYFYKNSKGEEPNKNIGFTRSQHLVLGLDYRVSENVRFKAESYYQQLDNIPVDPFPSDFALINAGSNYDRLPDKDGLVNKGTGQNIGLELTLERFLNKGFYYLITVSIFDSKYKGSNGIEHNTAFNNNYVANGLVGYEYPVGKSKANVLFTDIRVATSGGMRYTPIDFEASSKAGESVRILSRSFESQAPAYFRLDVKVGFRQNFNRVTHEFAANIQNVTAHNNVLLQSYNRQFNQLVYRYQLGFFPVVQYKIEF